MDFGAKHAPKATIQWLQPLVGGLEVSRQTEGDPNASFEDIAEMVRTGVVDGVSHFADAGDRIWSRSLALAAKGLNNSLVLSC